MRVPRLRWPLPQGLTSAQLAGQRLEAITRRGKYLLLRFAGGSLIVHLGMSGSLRFMSAWRAAAKSRPCRPALRTRLAAAARSAAIRRGAVARRRSGTHGRASAAGPARGRAAGRGLRRRAAASRARGGGKVAIKQLLLAGQVVVGVGNIYASESLFRAGHPPDHRSGALVAAPL
jgi:formamidopyrimidine-DNA glycosylase